MGTGLIRRSRYGQSVRILLVTHEDLARSATRGESRFSLALVEAADVTVVRWEELDSPSMKAAAAAVGVAPSHFDVCMVFVRVRLLADAAPFDWSGFDGMRVWFEEDAWFAYSIAHPEWHNRFPDLYRRNRFDLMISTGRYTTERLCDEGVNAVWVPKGFGEDAFEDLGHDRSGICTFGTLWHSRRAMLDSLRRGGLDVVDVSGPFETLNERLNQYAACVVCNMPGRPPFGRPGRLVARRYPSIIRITRAVEPMAKTFESAAAGCAPVVDHLDELDALGFVDGETCLTYSSFADAQGVLDRNGDDDFRRIGRAAGELARNRHTWRHRAESVLRILERP